MNAPLTTTLRFSTAPHPSVLAATDSIEALLGFSAEQFLHGQADWMQRVHPDDQPTVKRLLAGEVSPARALSPYGFCTGMAAFAASRSLTG